MNPRIHGTGFGYIDVEGQRITHDIVIWPSGTVEKRKKKLSKKIYGTSHMLSMEEARYIYRDSVDLIIIGSGQYGRLRLSEEAAAFFDQMRCKVELHSTPEAIVRWNESMGSLMGLFHVTC
jgi:hypothetical protein